jgi:hypothetical protein
MSYGDIRINASITRRIKSRDGYDEATLGLSQVPASSTDEDMRAALHSGLHLLDLIKDELADRLRLPASVTAPAPAPVVPSLFPKESATAPDRAPVAHPPKRRQEMGRIKTEEVAPSPAEVVAKVVAEGLGLPKPEPTPTLAEQVAQIVGDTNTRQTSIYVGDPEDLPSPIEPAKSAPIPVADDIDLPTPFTPVLGIGIRIPPVDDPRWSEPISERNRDGCGHGQLMAINAALTSRGFRGGERHQASSAILNGVDYADDRPRANVEIESIRDLSMAQACIILEWLDQAEDNDIDRLHEAIGQPSLAGAGEVL